MKMRLGEPVLIILTPKVHLMIINMKIGNMENKLLHLPGNLVQIEVDMRGKCLVQSLVPVA